MVQISPIAAALKAADWFVATQVLLKKPHWDANHGRFVYTYHIPTKNRVLGLAWTQGRRSSPCSPPGRRPADLSTSGPRSRAESTSSTSKSSTPASRDASAPSARSARPRGTSTLATRSSRTRPRLPGPRHRRRRVALPRSDLRRLVHRPGPGRRGLGSGRLLPRRRREEAQPGQPHLLPGRRDALLLEPGQGHRRRQVPGSRLPADGPAPARALRPDDGVILSRAREAKGEAAVSHHDAKSERYRGLAVNDDALG